MTSSHDQMVIVQKYEAFINYFYPVAQNMPRQHGVVKEMFTRDMLACTRKHRDHRGKHY